MRRPIMLCATKPRPCVLRKPPCNGCSCTAIAQETASSARAVVQTITHAEREASDVMRRAIEAMAAIEACAQEIGRMIR